MPGIFSQCLAPEQGLSKSKFMRKQCSLGSSSVASTSTGATYRSEFSSSSNESTTSSKPPRYPRSSATSTNPFYSNKENSGAMDFRAMSSAIEEAREQPSTQRSSKASRPRLERKPTPGPLEEDWGYFVDCAEW